MVMVHAPSKMERKRAGKGERRGGGGGGGCALHLPESFTPRTNGLAQGQNGTQVANTYNVILERVDCWRGRGWVGSRYIIMYISA